MKKYTLVSNDKKIKFKVPQGFDEINYLQWKKALPYLLEIDKVQNNLDNGEFETANKVVVDSICHIIASLSQGVKCEELMQCDYVKIVNLFTLDFMFLQTKSEKRVFDVNGKTVVIPDFTKRSAGSFMDAMDLLKQADENDADVGVTLLSVYLQDAEYSQDIEKINQTKEWLIKNGRMDLFRSMSFFLLTFMSNSEIPIKRHLKIQTRLEQLTSTLKISDIMHFLRVLQKLGFYQITKRK